VNNNVGDTTLLTIMLGIPTSNKNDDDTTSNNNDDDRSFSN
jgi:hypothetical protein